MPDTDVTRWKKRRRLRVGRAALLVLLVAGIILAASAVWVFFSALRNMPDWNPAVITSAMTTTVYDAESQPVATLHGPQNRFPVLLSQIPKHLQEALISTEDRRFYRHHGVDPIAIARAAAIDLVHASIRQGGSTITQQLAENAFFEKQESTFRRKVQEVIMALKLERIYSKEEILEFYLNEVYFGNGAYGVQAASRAYYNKDVEELNLAESTMLIGLIQSPGTYNPLKEGNLPKAKERQGQVLDNMVRYQDLGSAEAEAAKKTELQFNQGQTDQTGNRFPFYIDQLLEEAEALLATNHQEKSLFTGGLKIYTSLDTKAQEKLEAVFANSSYFPKDIDSDPAQAAMVVVDSQSGGVTALIGGRSHQAQRGWNRATHAKRQPGSSIKPIAVYAPAIEEAGYSPSSVVDDSPVSFGNYSPRNYDGRYRGLINIREALKRSINIAAVKVLNDIGVERGYNFARNLGLPVTSSSKNLALALGATEASPMEMAGAYTAFANGGVWVEPHIITKITDRFDHVLVEVTPNKKAVMSEQTAFLVTDMLQTVVKEGTGTRARLDRPCAGKTGTTELPNTSDFAGKSGVRDAWFIGYTPELVGAVWMGYDTTDSRHYLQNVAGGTYPAEIWKTVMSEALSDQPVSDFPRPAGIVYVPIDIKSGLLPSDLTPSQFIVTEVFAQDRVPTKISDVWAQAQICTDSHQLATPGCPSKATGVFLKNSSGASEDASLALPTEYCSLHGNGEHRAETASSAVHAGLSAVDAKVMASRQGTYGYVVVLQWNASSKNNLKFIVERSEQWEETRSKLGVVKGNSYVDPTVQPGTSYTYWVRTESQNSGTSSYAEPASVLIPMD